MIRLDLLETPALRRIYLAGIAGSAMGTLAAMLKERGFEVSGSDEHVYPPMDRFLQEQRIPVHVGFDPGHLQPPPDLAVIGNALSRGNPEVEYILDEGIRYASLPEVLREFFIRGRTSVVVTGTHGKTTTTALTAWILTRSGRDPSLFLGGIANNWGRGYHVGTGQHIVVEGDEYDTAFFDKGPKFLHYLPRVLVVNTIEFDHADIYRSLDDILTNFRRLVNLVPRKGVLIGWAGDRNVRDLFERAHCPVVSFGEEGQADWWATGIAVDERGTSFDAWFRGSHVGRFHVPLYGEHNVRNALAATAVCHWLGLTAEEIAAGLASFAGVRRRLEVYGEVDGVLLLDDFAHHPTEVRETLKAVRLRFPGRRIVALFEPRTATSRRAIFQQEYARAFDAADVVIIAPVHRPDKTGGDPVLDTARLAADLRSRAIQAWAEGSIDDVARRTLELLDRGDVVITLSNGSFGGIHEKLLHALRMRSQRT